MDGWMDGSEIDKKREVLETAEKQKKTQGLKRVCRREYVLQQRSRKADAS